MLKEIIDAKPENHQSSGKFPISSIGLCWRQKYLEIKKLYTQEWSQKILRGFDIGNAFHRQIVKELFQKSEQFNWRIITGEVDIPSHPFISGRCDIILANSKTREQLIVDVKSVSQWMFKQIETESKNIDRYKKQMQLYLYFFKIKRGVLLFVNKSSGEINEIIIEYDKKLCLELIKSIEDFFKNYVNKNVEPPKCDGGLWGCDCCKIYPKKENEILPPHK